MAEYICWATFTAVADTAEHAFLEVSAPSGVSILVKHIKVLWATPATDNAVRLRVRRTSTAMTNSTSRTTNAMRNGAPATVCTVVAKASSASSTPGTNVALLMDTAFNGKASFEWVARDKNDFLESEAGGRICITLTKSSTAGGQAVEIMWVE